MGLFDDIVPPDTASDGGYRPLRITVRPKGVEPPPEPGNAGGLFDDIVPLARSDLFDDIVPPADAPASDMPASEGGQFAAPLPDGRNFRVAREGISPAAGFADRLAAMWENPPKDRPSLIGLIKSGYEGATLAGDVLSGKTPIMGPNGHTSDEVISRAKDLAQVSPLRGAPGGFFGRSIKDRVANPLRKAEGALSDEAAAVAPRETIAPTVPSAAPRQILAEASEQGVPIPRSGPQPHARPPDKTAAQSDRIMSEARESGPFALEGREREALRSGAQPPAKPPDKAAAQSDRMKSGARESGPFDSKARSADAPPDFIDAAKNPTVEARGGAYVLRDTDGAVMRSGRTGNLAERKDQHRRDRALPEHQFDPAYRTDSYPEQRGLEQILHDRYDPPLNKIRPISPSNKNIDYYMGAARKYLREHGEK